MTLTKKTLSPKKGGQDFCGPYWVRTSDPLLVRRLKLRFI